MPDERSAPTATSKTARITRILKSPSGARLRPRGKLCDSASVLARVEWPNKYRKEISSDT